MTSDNNGQLKNNMIYKPKKPHLSEEFYDNNISNDIPKNYSNENLEEVMHMNNNNNDKIYNDEEEYLEAKIQNNKNKYEYENNYHDRNEDINISNDQNNLNYENENNEEINHIQNNSNEFIHEENDDIKENYENIENMNSSQNNNQNLYDSEENNDIDEDTIHNQNINNKINLNNDEVKNKNYNNNEENIDADRSDNIYQENENEMNEQKNNEKYNLPLSINNISKNIKNNLQKENEIINEISSNLITNDQNQNKIDSMEDKIKEGDIYNNNLNLNENTDLKISDNESNNNTNNLNKNTNYKELTIKISDGVKFGVDVSGNPVDISHFDENKDNSSNKIIAFIIEKENENNYLIDIKGNVLKKSDDDYYCYKEGEEIIIIKDFDVQHPELRVYGHRKINFNELQNEKDEEIKKELNFDKYKYKDNIDLKDKYDNNIQDYETNRFSPIANINKKEKDKNNINLNKNIDEMILNNIKNVGDITQENNNNNAKKVNSSTYFKTDGNNNIKISNEFKDQMVIWRHRYGKKNGSNNYNNIINKSDYRNYSYNSDDKMINRTGSILNLASERIMYNKQSDKSRKIPISLKNNKYFYNKNPLTEIKLFDGIKNPLIKNQNNSFTKNPNNPLLNHYKRRNILINENIHAFKRLNLNRDEKIKNQRIPRNLTLENFNIKNNNIDKSANSNYKKNLESHEVKYQIRDDIMKNIRNKNKNIKNSFHFINKSENLKDMNISYDIKGHDINNYIHYNLTKMNENKNRKNLNIKYSILSNEANQLIKNFSRKQTEINGSKNIVIDTLGGYTKYSDRDIKYSYNSYIKNKNKRNDLIKDSYSYYDKNPNLYFNYENENENKDSDDSKFKIVPNKLQKHKISILNNNFYKGGFERQSKNIGDFYQRMKHNTSYNNYKNI